MKKTLLLTLFIVLVAAFGTKAQTVYSSAKGEKYHTADCNLSGEATGMKLDAAKKAGKQPCGVCKPNDHFKDKVTQCTGKTADGTRCKRMTSSKAGKCYQHTSK